ncbi:hypothetical protein Q4R69_17875 [Morganella morganii subsp. sibonii]
MKKMFAVVLSAAFLLAGCGGDNGELAGVYKSPNNDIISLEYKENAYQVKLNNPYSPPNIFMERDGSYLIVPSDGRKKFFEIKDATLINLNSNKVYNKLSESEGKRALDEVEAKKNKGMTGYFDLSK